MLTNKQADDQYESAANALHSIATSFEATDEQRKTAIEKREELTLAFIGKAIASVEARTARFQKFIDEMNEVIAEFDPDTAIAGVIKLKDVVDEAGSLVAAATGQAAPATRGKRVPRGRQPAKAARKRTGRRKPARKAAKPKPGARKSVRSRTQRKSVRGKAKRKARRAERKPARKKKASN